MEIFARNGVVSRSRETLAHILEAVNQTKAITRIASDIELFVQEYGMAAVHLRGIHRKTGLVVIIKVGTSSRENSWTKKLHKVMSDLVPKVYASGAKLGNIKVHWMAMEAIPFGLGDSWKGKEFDLLLDAGIRFYQASTKINDPTLLETTQETVKKWLQRSLIKRPPGPIDNLLAKVYDHWGLIDEKCGREVAFDDFHLANVMTKEPPPNSRSAILIDIHPRWQPWILDPAYLQVLNSNDPNRPGHKNLISRMARKRKDADLRSLESDELEMASKIALGWMAARQWKPEVAKKQPEYRAVYEKFISEASEI